MKWAREHPVTAVLVGIFLSLLVVALVVVILQSTKPSAAPSPEPSPPSSPFSKHLSMYVEDCQQAESLRYDLDQLARLELISFDFSKRCYDHNKATLQALVDRKYTGKLFVHFDQTAQSKTCGASMAARQRSNAGTRTEISERCVSTLKSIVGDDAAARIDGVLWEKENNVFTNNCGDGPHTPTCRGAFAQAFGRNVQFAGWTWGKYFDFLYSWPQSYFNEWDYVFYQYYNLWSADKEHVCSKKKSDNATCHVDYNPPGAKCFQNAQTYADETRRLRANCGRGADTVYCAADITPAQRGQWMAKLLVDHVSYRNLTPEAASKTVLFFTFTNKSDPTWLGTITTAHDFDAFVEAFRETFRERGVHNIDLVKFGAWGCPKWIAHSTSTFCD